MRAGEFVERGDPVRLRCPFPVTQPGHCPRTFKRQLDEGLSYLALGLLSDASMVAQRSAYRVVAEVLRPIGVRCTCVGDLDRSPGRPIYVASGVTVGGERDIPSAPPREARVTERFIEFAAGAKYPAIIGLWDDVWNDFVPFLDYDAEIRRGIRLTHAIESVNARYRPAIHSWADFLRQSRPR